MEVAAQQMPHYTMFRFNKQMINPGYVGTRDALSMSALYRHQWAGITGAPRTFNAGIHSPVGPDPETARVGLGLLLYNDAIGVENVFGIGTQYSYRFPVTDNAMLSFGLQLGLINYNGNFSKLNPRDGFQDPSIEQDVRNVYMPDVKAGAFLYSENYYVGLSVGHVIQNLGENMLTSLGDDLLPDKNRHFFLMGGYIWEMNDDWKLNPNVMLKAVYNGGRSVAAPLDADLNLTLMYLDRFSIGASYRLSESIDAMLVVQATNNLRIGFAYDYLLTELSNYSSGSYEFLIGYDISNTIKAITTPRFIKFF